MAKKKNNEILNYDIDDIEPEGDTPDENSQESLESKKADCKFPIKVRARGQDVIIAFQTRTVVFTPQQAKEITEKEYESPQYKAKAKLFQEV